MKIKINGRETTTETIVFADFISEINTTGEKFLAASLNSKILPRDEWPETRLNEGDSIEVFSIVGGG